MRIIESVRRRSAQLLERAGNGSRVSWKLLVGVILVPVLFASGFLWATWRADDRLRTVQAAVVNLDEAVTINGQITPLGRELTAELVDSEREKNITWVLSDEEDAEAGLRSGRYAAVVTIPKTFSAAATSFSKNDDTAHQATIQITTSEITGVVDGAVANTLAQAAVAALNRMLTEQYLDNIYLGFNKMGEQFQTVVDGADQLADGGEQLADGVQQAATGVHTLDDGMTQLADGGTKLVDGGTKLDEGGAKLAAGGTKLADGGTKLADGATSLATGVKQYTGGVSQLADGVTAYTDGVSQYAKGVDQYEKGIAKYADGVDQYADAIDENFAPLLPYLQQLPDTVIDLKQAAKEARAFSDAVQTWSESGVDLKAELKKTNDAVQLYATQVGDYVDMVEAIANGTKTVPCPDEIKNQYGDEGCAGFSAGVQQMAKAALVQMEGAGGKQGLEDLAKAMATQSQDAYDALAPLIVDAKTLAQTADSVADKLEELATKTPTISTKDLKDQIAALLAAPRQLADGAADLADGATQLSDGADKLAAGGEKLGTGAQQLATGGTKLSKGADDLATGVGAYTAGVATFTDGVSQYVDGVDQYTDGVATYADGVGQAAKGVSALADGMDDLGTGADKLADGQRQLADGLAKGVKQMPSYDKNTREKLSNAVSEPLSSSNLDELVVPRVVWASLLMVLAMWLGALATYVLFKAISSRVMMSDAATPRLVARAMAPGLGIVGVQALAVAVIGQAAVQLPWQKVGLMFAFLALAAVTFVALNQALVAWFRGAGRLISVAFVVLTFASALTYAVPRFFAVARNLSPLTPALDGLRAIMTDGSALTSSTLALLGWAALGIGGALAAILRARKLSVDQLITRKTG